MKRLRREIIVWIGILIGMGAAVILRDDEMRGQIHQFVSGNEGLPENK